jgi:hypothetical protein
MVCYVYDGNYIEAIPIKNRSEGEFKRAYEYIYEMCTTKGYKPTLHKLDNESSRDLKEWISEQQTKLQFTPPDMHRTNAAEKAIQTWKNHFLSGLASLPAEFPIAHWCQLIPQANITLNLLRASRMNLALSTQAAMHRCYQFEVTPMAPPGTKAFIHIKPHRREHGVFMRKMGGM